MDPVRIYGDSPYRTFVIHGGPGAAGEMAPVAKQLSGRLGVAEPLQSKKTVTGLVDELKSAVEQYSNASVTLVGHSWGAWLSVIFAANHSRLVNKLILIGSGPFEEYYARGIKETRLSRLNEAERNSVRELERKLINAGSERNSVFRQYGELMAKADSFDPLPEDQSDELEVNPDIFQSVWKEASALRSSGELLEQASRVTCPVVVIHGDYDPHPYDGVIRPLEANLKELRSFILNDCGHTPWIERRARDDFYKILFEELLEN